MASGTPIFGLIGGETYKVLSSINNKFVISDDASKLPELIKRCINSQNDELQIYSKN